MAAFENLETLPRIVAVATAGSLATLLVASTAWADNPIVQTLYTADPAPMVHEGRLYLYTTHDEDQLVNDFFTMNDWRVYSSTDAVNWVDHGSPLHYRQFSWAGGDAWAGQVVHRNGTFFFYVPLRRPNGGNAIGVATSDSPTGPFVDALGVPLVTSDCGDIDPTVFIDDDDQAYLYWGNPNLCYVRLNDDMVSYQGDVVRVPLSVESFGMRRDNERPTSYEEGPWFYKRQGLYYMVFAAGPISEHVGYSTSSAPTGPWSYRGVVMPTEGGSFTNHPGVIDYKGKSLFFYHNGALPGGGGFHRSVSVEEFTYGADGSIPQMTMSREGASAVDVLNPFARVEAETMAWGDGVETDVCSEGGMKLTDIDDGDYVKLKEVEFGSGAESFEVRAAAGSPGASIEVRLDSVDGALVGTCQVDSTGGADTWGTQSCIVSNATGKHDLFLVFRGASFEFNWWKFVGPGDPASAGAGGQAGVGGAGGAPNQEGVGGTTGAGGSAGSNSMAPVPPNGEGGAVSPSPEPSVAEAPAPASGSVTEPPPNGTATPTPPNVPAPVPTAQSVSSGVVSNPEAPTVAATSTVAPAGEPSNDGGCRFGPARSPVAPSSAIAMLSVLLLARRHSRGNRLANPCVRARAATRR